VPDVATLPAPVRTVVEAAFGEAIADLFLIAVPLGLVTLAAVLLLHEVPLGTRSGLEQRLADDALAGEGSAAQAPPGTSARG
jgi:hypothetical protein